MVIIVSVVDFPRSKFWWIVLTNEINGVAWVSMILRKARGISTADLLGIRFLAPSPI